MSKSPDAFRTISEVADWLETPAHVLRFWESRFSQIKPVKRAGGRRYYRPADMLLLGGIKKLLHDDGITIKAVQNLLRDKGVKHVQALSRPVSVQVVLKKKSPVSTTKPAPETVPEAPLQKTLAGFEEETTLDSPDTSDEDIGQAEASTVETDLVVIDMPARFKSASEINRADIPEIEALYYSLKMVRNNMRRTGAGR
ncbi:MAG: MerR family transcriptional regulator [Rhodobacterales bacterium]